MEWRIVRDSGDPVLVFAADELTRYLVRIDPAVETAIFKSDGSTAFKHALLLQVGGDNLPLTECALLDDAYDISVEDGAGVIAGSNPRSLLFGVYRFLRELGCRWLRPGSDGELVPRRDLSSSAVKVRDLASYRHRGVCIEGSSSFGHVRDMIDWLPKIGMNAYFNQFSAPFAFFDYWYGHANNPYMEAEPLSVDEVTAMVEVLVEHIKKRGLLYHAVGHGWTCDPIGIRGLSWEKEEFKLSDDQRELLALVDGKRDVYMGVALNTNLCYSNPRARDKIIEAIINFCRSRRDVDYLHFWLADEANNHCECESCKDVLPADYYVMMLNEIDRRLTAEGIPTKIVFLIYFDLLWEPQTERLENQDRFTLMFAPITRSYTTAYYSDSANAPLELAPFSRNKLEMPKSVGENIARLDRWLEQFSGDSFVFDYHLIWDHYHDPGGYESARILFEDMKNLDKLGLRGMISCQVQRAFFPTGLAMNAMAAALWNKHQVFDAFAEEFFSDMFGDFAGEMRVYFEELSILFQPSYMRGEREYVDTKSAGLFDKIPCVINRMSPLLNAHCENEIDPCRKKNWFALTKHAQLCIYLADALSRKARGQQSGALACWERAADYANSIEHLVHSLFDVKYFIDVAGRAIRGELRFE